MPVVKSWKTTAAGVAGLLSALAFAFTQYINGGVAAVNFEVLITAITVSVGLIFAKDSNVSNAPNPGPALKVAKPASVATAAKIGTVLALLSLAAPAVASDPFVQCLGGCQQIVKGSTLKASLRAAGDTQIADVWFLGPSVGMALASRDNATGVWQSNIAFQFAYGLKFKPAWWSATATFMSFDLGLQAGMANMSSPDFTVTLAPTVSFLDLIAIGFGPRFHLSNGTSVSGVLFLGLSTSFGAP